MEQLEVRAVFKACACMQILGGQVEAPVEFLPLYDVLATMPSQCAMKTPSTDTQTDASGGAAPPKAKGVFKKLFSKNKT